MEDNTIVIKNVNRGGIAESRYSGIPDSVAMMVGLDIHSEPGIIKINNELALHSDAGTDINEFCLDAIACSNGVIYWFSSESGKIWEDDDGDLSLVYTTAPTRGEAKILSAIEYQGHIYWTTQNYVHRILVAKTSDWATNAEPNYMELNLDQPAIDGLGDTYTTATSISEAAAHRQTVQFHEDDIEGIAVYVDAKGTGNVTLTLHDSANSVIQAITIANASLINDAFNYFDFTATFNPVLGNEYHIHVTSTVADAEIGSLVADDAETIYTKLYTTADSKYHPLLILNGVLYIGDRQYIHQIETIRSAGLTVPSNFALDIPQPYRVTDLAIFETDLVLGTIVDNDVNEAKVFRWNTWSDTYSNDDGVEEVGIRAFIPADNYLFAVAGVNGHIYAYNGQKLEPVTRIPGTYTPTSTIEINPSSIVTVKGIQLFGVSALTGDATKQGIWSFGANSVYYPRVLNLEYPISPREAIPEGSAAAAGFVTSGVEIGAAVVKGNDYYVSWRRTDGVTITTGVDKLDYEVVLDGAYLESRAVTNHRHLVNTFKNVYANYISLPTNTNIEVYHRKDYSGSWTQITNNVAGYSKQIFNDPERLRIEAILGLPAVPIEVKTVFRRDPGNTDMAPILESIYINVQ